MHPDEQGVVADLGAGAVQAQADVEVLGGVRLGRVLVDDLDRAAHAVPLAHAGDLVGEAVGVAVASAGELVGLAAEVLVGLELVGREPVQEGLLLVKELVMVPCGGGPAALVVVLHGARAEADAALGAVEQAVALARVASRLPGWPTSES